MTIEERAKQRYEREREDSVASPSWDELPRHRREAFVKREEARREKRQHEFEIEEQLDDANQPPYPD